MLQISIIDMTLKMTNLKLQQHFPGDNELTQPRKTTTTYMAFVRPHYSDVIMIAMASQITSIKIVCSTIYLGTNQRKHQSSALLAFVREICRWMELCMHTKNIPMCLKHQLLIKVHEWEIDCNDVSLLFGYNTETEMLSFWWNFNHWLHRKLSFWQLSVQPVMKISSKWRHFCFSV